MRIAISGTHSCGKSTLIDAFLVRHADYVHEPEPYEVLQELHGEGFAADPSADDFYRQLDYHVERVSHYRAGDRVIFERSAADFMAYLLALGDLRRDTTREVGLAAESIAAARSALAQLEVIVYLPARGGAGVAADEDPDLRRAVDARLEGILLDNELGLLGEDGPRVVEAVGSTGRRLQTLEGLLG